MTVVRPLHFDAARRVARLKKQRESRKRRLARKYRLANFFASIFWFEIEPPLMWDYSPWHDRQTPTGYKDGANDNDRKSRPRPIPDR